MIIKSEDYWKAYRSFYLEALEADPNGTLKLTIPAPMKIPPGTWRLDGIESLYGTQVDQLVLLYPDNLVPTEDPWQGRGHYVHKYVEWLQQGLTPPPIEVIQIERRDGSLGLKITDGHRRWAAAQIAKRRVPAWVSWSVPSPSGLLDSSNGRPILTGLTVELAPQHGFVVA